VRVAARVLDDFKRVALHEPVAPAQAKLNATFAPSASVGLLTSGSQPLLLTDAAAPSHPSSASGPGGVAASRAAPAVAASASAAPHTAASTAASTALIVSGTTAAVNDVIASISQRTAARGVSTDDESQAALRAAEELAAKAQANSRAIVARRMAAKVPTPKWHAPWKLMRVISGHLGWVRSVAVEPGNEWFVTGAADRTIKVWDLASGTLKLTLTGHINTVRGLAVSPRHPYLFSCAEDKMVKCEWRSMAVECCNARGEGDGRIADLGPSALRACCSLIFSSPFALALTHRLPLLVIVYLAGWDLEYNKVIRHYHGHLSGVYSLALHPTLDILMTGGRDSVCRVWDMRTKQQIHSLAGHENSVSSIIANSVDPQVITGSMDSTVRLWDLAAGKVRTVLTHHKKAIRGMCGHPKEFAFVSGAADNIKKWALPAGELVSNFSGHNSIVNTVSMNADDVLVSGGDDGSLRFWDYSTGYGFQDVQSRGTRRPRQRRTRSTWPRGPSTARSTRGTERCELVLSCIRAVGPRAQMRPRQARELPADHERDPRLSCDLHIDSNVFG
jgi:WD40 repeat protein